ncbi:MAG: DNA-methyltransferase [Geminicoccaceae bacterium]
MIEPVTIGNATLYCGDCLEIMPTLGKVDAVVTDPPYGINIGGAGTIGGAGKITHATKYGKHEWDKVGLNQKQFDLIREADEWIIWGANHLTDIVGSFPGALIWDKKCQNGWNDTFSDAEIAATNIITRTKVYRHLWVGALRVDEGSTERFHPTQKPFALMKWCLSFVSGQIILDPFMGSGTTGVACAKFGRKFIGIEIEPKYFDIACKRIEEAYAQPDLFIPEPLKPKQEVMQAIVRAAE